MRSWLGLYVLSALCLHNPTLGESGVLIFCDDHSVETAAHSAVTKFNQGVKVGAKMALYQILAATKSESGSDTVYSLQFTSRRSKCLSGDDKPWTDCDYLPGNKELFPCNATVHMTEMEADTREVNCLLDNHAISSRASCLGCPIAVDVDSEDLKSPLSLSVSNFNSNSNHTHHFKLNRVVHATRQVVAGFRFKLRFDLLKTTCAKAEHADLHELCEVDMADMEFANCNATVDVAPWRHELPNTDVVCEKGELQRFTRRRPPGWSPLRCLNGTSCGQPLATTAAPSTTASSAAPATTAGPKDASSEEDSTSSAASASASGSPFHCPSKPWKEEPAAPTQQAEAEKEGTFSDADLLA